MSGMRFEENRITRFTLYTRIRNPCTYFRAAVDDHKDNQFLRRLLLVLYATARPSIQRLVNPSACAAQFCHLCPCL